MSQSCKTQNVIFYSFILLTYQHIIVERFQWLSEIKTKTSQLHQTYTNNTVTQQEQEANTTIQVPDPKRGKIRLQIGFMFYLIGWSSNHGNVSFCFRQITELSITKTKEQSNLFIMLFKFVMIGHALVWFLFTMLKWKPGSGNTNGKHENYILHNLCWILLYFGEYSFTV